MAEQKKRRFLDVWLVEANTVYREVPYDVVADWIQQARLIPEDMIRPSGTANWFKVGESPDFQPYLPKPETIQIEDEASALEPVHMDFTWKRRHEDEDDDVDMIPLIDVSMVLLVFFMLTSTVAAGVFISMPGTDHGLVTANTGMIYVNVRPTADPKQEADFTIQVGEGAELKFPDTATDPKKPHILWTVGEVAEQVRKLAEGKREIEATIRADQSVPSGLIRDLTVELNKIPGAQIRKYIGVTERRR